MASHNSAEAEPNDEQRHFHAAASRPEGPAAPSVVKAVSCINWPSICSNRMKCGSLGGSLDSMMAEGLEGVFLDVSSSTIL